MKSRGVWHSPQWPGPSTRYWPRRTRSLGAVEREHRRGGKIEPLPEADAAADVEGKAERMAGDPVRHRRQRVEERLQVDHVLDPHARVGRVGEGRIVVRAARRDAAHHGVDEIERRPAADAGLRVGRDVRNAEDAEIGLELKPAGELQLFLALRARRGVAGRAAAGVEDALAVREVGRVRGNFAAPSGAGAVRNQPRAAAATIRIATPTAARRSMD